jgi:hypothetical protein
MTPLSSVFRIPELQNFRMIWNADTQDMSGIWVTLHNITARSIRDFLLSRFVSLLVPAEVHDPL